MLGSVLRSEDGLERTGGGLSLAAGAAGAGPHLVHDGAHRAVPVRHGRGGGGDFLVAKIKMNVVKKNNVKR